MFAEGDIICKKKYGSSRQYKILQVFESDNEMKVQALDTGKWYMVGRHSSEMDYWILV